MDMIVSHLDTHKSISLTLDGVIFLLSTLTKCVRYCNIIFNVLVDLFFFPKKASGDVTIVRLDFIRC